MHIGPNIVKDGLVLYLDAANKKSYPGSGTNWADLSGNGNDGTLTNGFAFDAYDGKSISVDGLNDYILLNDSITLGINTSISFWGSSTETDTVSRYLRLLDNTSGTAYFEFEYYNRILTRTDIDTSFFFCTNLNPAPSLNNEITNITFCFEADTSTSIYINGVKSTYNNGSAIIGELTFNAIMRSRSSYNPGGKIACFQAYNRALSESEVLQNYNALKNRYNI